MGEDKVYETTSSLIVGALHEAPATRPCLPLWGRCHPLLGDDGEGLRYTQLFGVHGRAGASVPPSTPFRKRPRSLCGTRRVGALHEAPAPHRFAVGGILCVANGGKQSRKLIVCSWVE